MSKTALKGLTVSLQIEPWQHHCAELKAQHAWDYDPPTEHVYAPRLLRDLDGCEVETYITCDVGQHQMWVAQHYPFSRPEHHLTSAGLGAMGYSPAAIGVQLAHPDARVINVTGDGSIMMNVQELATINATTCPLRVSWITNARWCANGRTFSWANVIASDLSIIRTLSNWPRPSALAVLSHPTRSSRGGDRATPMRGLLAHVVSIERPRCGRSFPLESQS